MLVNPTWLQKHGTEYHAFAILTMCRALHSLQNGTIVSKPTAARWAQKELGEEWSQVIEQALNFHEGHDLYNKSLELIRYTMEQTRTPSLLRTR